MHVYCTTYLLAGRGRDEHGAAHRSVTTAAVVSEVDENVNDSEALHGRLPLRMTVQMERVLNGVKLKSTLW